MLKKQQSDVNKADPWPQRQHWTLITTLAQCQCCQLGGFLASDVSESFLSSQSHKLLESESSKIFWVESESWRCRVESLRVIGLQARVNVESHEISRFFYIFLLWNGAW